MNPRPVFYPIRGARVKLMQRQMGITQGQMSKDTGIAQQNLSLMMNGKANVTENTARVLASVYPQYSEAWILGYADWENEEEEKKLRDLAAHGEAEALLLYLTFCAGVNARKAPDGYMLEGVYMTEGQFVRFSQEISEYVQLRVKQMREV